MCCPTCSSPGLRIVFCGTAAGNVSAARGAYYAHPQNRFWSALHALRADAAEASAGGIFRIAAMGLRPHRHRQARERHGSRTASGRRARPRGLRRARSEDHRRRARLARLHEPQRRAPLSRRAAGFGEQPERIGRTRLWVLPSPSPTAGWNWSATRTGGGRSPTRRGSGSRPPQRLKPNRRASPLGLQPTN